MLCGSKEKYRHVKDLHMLKAHVGVIKYVILKDIFTVMFRPSSFSGQAIFIVYTWEELKT